MMLWSADGLMNSKCGEKLEALRAKIQVGGRFCYPDGKHVQPVHSCLIPTICRIGPQPNPNQHQNQKAWYVLSGRCLISAADGHIYGTKYDKYPISFF